MSNHSSVIRMTRDGAAGVKLEPCALVPPEAVIEGVAVEMGATVFAAKDGNFLVGIWQSTPYAEYFDGYPTNEFCCILQGSATLTDDKGNSQRFVAGDCYVVPMGFKGTFRVEELFRKYYVVSPA